MNFEEAWSGLPKVLVDALEGAKMTRAIDFADVVENDEDCKKITRLVLLEVLPPHEVVLVLEILNHQLQGLITASQAPASTMKAVIARMASTSSGIQLVEDSFKNLNVCEIPAKESVKRVVVACRKVACVTKRLKLKARFTPVESKAQVETSERTKWLMEAVSYLQESNTPSVIESVNSMDPNIFLLRMIANASSYIVVSTTTMPNSLICDDIR